MNILLLGSGGREHAMAWKMSQSSILDNLYVAPGNAGTANVATNVNIKEDDFDAIKDFVLAENIEIVVVGPEAPLVKGIRDYFESDSELSEVCVIGPDSMGARLEGSKDFAKRFMAKHNVPTAKYKSFTSGQLKEASIFLDELKPPYVLKADGLAAGKGVLILDSKIEAISELEQMFDGKFGKASETVVIEEFLKGIELSVFVLTDGDSYRILPAAKDYKRIGEGDTGLNTGGMGAISPVPFADQLFMERVENQVIIPTINGLKKDEIDYRGFIFIGLMNVNGEPYVIEYNVRMGDPETEVVMPRIATDLVDLFEHIKNKTLSEADFEHYQNVVSTVIAVSGGYPEAYEKGKEIQGISEDLNEDKQLLFHAGTKINDGKIVTNGGRVLACTGIGDSIENALKNSYQLLDQISFEKINFRKDIGQDLLEKA